MSFTYQHMKIIRWAASEVDRQNAGPLAVPRMLDAHNYALTNVVPFDAVIREDITLLGKLVDPAANKEGFRIGPAVFTEGREATKPEHIERQVELLLVNQEGMTPLEFVHRFLEIHPFRDGNGRVASILWNCQMGYILDPKVLPEMEFV